MLTASRKRFLIGLRCLLKALKWFSALDPFSLITFGKSENLHDWIIIFPNSS